MIWFNWTMPRVEAIRKEDLIRIKSEMLTSFRLYFPCCFHCNVIDVVWSRTIVNVQRIAEGNLCSCVSLDLIQSSAKKDSLIRISSNENIASTSTLRIYSSRNGSKRSKARGKEEQKKNREKKPPQSEAHEDGSVLHNEYSGHRRNNFPHQTHSRNIAKRASFAN